MSSSRVNLCLRQKIVECVNLSVLNSRETWDAWSSYLQEYFARHEDFSLNFWHWNFHIRSTFKWIDSLDWKINFNCREGVLSWGLEFTYISHISATTKCGCCCLTFNSKNIKIHEIEIERFFISKQKKTLISKATTIDKDDNSVRSGSSFNSLEIHIKSKELFAKFKTLEGDLGSYWVAIEASPFWVIK